MMKKSLLSVIFVLMVMCFGGMASGADDDTVHGAVAMIKSYKVTDILMTKLNEILGSTDEAKDKAQKMEDLRIRALKLKGKYAYNADFAKNIDDFNNNLVEIMKHPDAYSPLDHLANRMKRMRELEKEYHGSSLMRKVLKESDVKKMQEEVNGVLKEMAEKVKDVQAKEEKKNPEKS